MDPTTNATDPILRGADATKVIAAHGRVAKGYRARFNIAVTTDERTQ